ncbi:thioester domain-containing protein [Arthrobacter sp.]|uniref:thioester domain-containing protein n=1 Tax=Arthrobacter sp. TaxID=1667 RepID=UPI00289D4106|nr:thioester domain-containing protein [Arthrobacter sp.]
MRNSLSLARARGQTDRRELKHLGARRGPVLGLLTAALLLVAPMTAIAVEPLPAVVITGFGPGLEIQGLHPGQGTVQNPLAVYPEANPAGYVDIDTFAGIVETANVDDPSEIALMYCINVFLETGEGTAYQLDSWAEANVPNIGYVTYILNNYYPMMPGPAGLNEDQQAAAVQAAIWYFTDGYVVDTSQTDIRAAVAAMVAAAQANGPVLEPGIPGIEITPESASAVAGSRAGPFTVNGQNVAGITVTVPDGFTLHTAESGGDGVASGSEVDSGTVLWVQNNTGEPGTGSLGAAAAVTVQAGSVYLSAGNPSAAQPLILAATRQLNASDSAVFAEAALSPGTLVVTKSITGGGAGSQGEIAVNVDCGPGLNETFTIPAGTPAGDTTTTFEGIADGTLCTVSEEVSGSNEVVNVVAGESVTVEIVSGTTVVAELSNDVQFIYGQLAVAKSFAGTGAGLQDRVVMTVVCNGEVADTIVIPAGSTDTVTRTYTEIPAGSSCLIREEESGQNAQVLVTADLPDPVVVTGGMTTTLEAVNTYTGRGQAWLPKTGANDTTGLAMMGGGILLAGTALVLGSRRRRRLG